MRAMTFTALAVLALAIGAPALAQVERIWLTHRTYNPSRIVVNWTTERPGNSGVRFGPTPEHGQTDRIAEGTTLHHVEITLDKQDIAVYHAGSSGDRRSPDATLRKYPLSGSDSAWSPTE